MYRIRVESSDPRAYYVIGKGKKKIVLTRDFKEFEEIPAVVKKKPRYFEVEKIENENERIMEIVTEGLKNNTAGIKTNMEPDIITEGIPELTEGEFFWKLRHKEKHTFDYIEKKTGRTKEQVKEILEKEREIRKVK